MIEKSIEQLKFEAEQQGKVLANGHIYKLYFDVDSKQVEDAVLANTLAQLGIVKIQHITDGGVNVAVTPTINTKENA